MFFNICCCSEALLGSFLRSGNPKSFSGQAKKYISGKDHIKQDERGKSLACPLTFGRYAIYTLITRTCLFIRLRNAQKIYKNMLRTSLHEAENEL